jgi:hypothetical protein
MQKGWGASLWTLHEDMLDVLHNMTVRWMSIADKWCIYVRKTIRTLVWCRKCPSTSIGGSYIRRSKSKSQICAHSLQNQQVHHFRQCQRNQRIPNESRNLEKSGNSLFRAIFISCSFFMLWIPWIPKPIFFYMMFKWMGISKISWLILKSSRSARHQLLTAYSEWRQTA